ncbi:MAG TPA: formyltransferase family protein, partial [Candidatus Cloacimonas sp.]|nr:formyltransferase family protein [Candidatus Cloacimonas sp.]
PFRRRWRRFAQSRPSLPLSAVHQAVFASGDNVSGATIHLVDSQYDNGKIVAQQEVDISSCKNPAEIADKVLEIEHSLYAPTIFQFLLKS